MNTGEKIKILRERRGLTQIELSKKILTSPQNISQYERGVRNPKAATLEKIAEALNVSSWELLDDDTKILYEKAVQVERGQHDAMRSDYMQGVIRTAETVPETECLAQLAEEACELAQAALKLRRAMGAGNPTPVSAEDAIANLEEEIADVQLCTAVLVYADGKINADNINKVMNQKAERWLERLKERDNNG